MTQILLVDDDRAFRRVYATLLRDAGHEVLEAHDRPSARAAMAEHRVPVAILDLMLPPDGRIDTGLSELSALLAGHRTRAPRLRDGTPHSQRPPGVELQGRDERDPPRTRGVARTPRNCCGPSGMPQQPHPRRRGARPFASGPTAEDAAVRHRRRMSCRSPHTSASRGSECRSSRSFAAQPCICCSEVASTARLSTRETPR